jgi:hypothetical protein
MRHKFIIIFVLTSLISFSKPYYIDLDKTIKTGKFFGEVVVLQYVLEMDSSSLSNVKSMTVKFFETKDSVFTIIKLCPSDYRSYLRYKTYDSRMNCYWPSVGDTVLMALDSTYALTFFGTKADNKKYKLYTPFFTGSATIFLSSKLLVPYKFGDKKQTSDRSTYNGAYSYIWGLYATKQELLDIRVDN